MNSYRHYISGFFAGREDADHALVQLVQQGLPRERLHIFAAAPASCVKQAMKSGEVARDLVMDGTPGAVVRSGTGALAEVGLVMANISLVVTHSLIAPLSVLGWGAKLGEFTEAAVGATLDSENKDPWFSNLIRDAISSGQVVLVVDTWSEQETATAQAMVEAAVGKGKNIAAA